MQARTARTALRGSCATECKTCVADVPVTLRGKQLALHSAACCPARREKAQHVHTHRRRLVLSPAFPWDKIAPASAAAPSAAAPVPGSQHSVPSAPPHFDLPLAVALAGAAFEAYLLPTGAEGLQLRSQNGAEVVFTDRTFLSETYQGILQVTVKSASGLRAADPTGASDPYVVLSVGASSGKTKFVFQNLNPAWNETFFLYVRDVSQDVLKVRVFDKDWLSSDDDLGVVMHALADLPDRQAMNLELPLKGPQATGTIRLEATLMLFKSYGNNLLDAVTSDGIVLPNEPADSKDQAMVAEMMDERAKAQREQEEQAALASLDPATLLPSFMSIKDQVMSSFESFFPTNSPETPATTSNKDASPASSDEEGAPTGAWRVLARMAGRCMSAATPVAYVDNPETDTQVWLYRNLNAREVIIAFRGTEQVKWKDIATDLNLTPSSFNTERVDTSQGLALPLRLLNAIKPTDEPMVHSGFLAAYDSVRQTVVQLLDMITSAGPDNARWRVYVTGHSLGGALATLCAYELAVRSGPARQLQDITMYTFGAPRVGNKAFATKFNETVPDSWRITNSNDIVPSVPRLMGYCHVNHGVKLEEAGRLQLQAEIGDIFGEGKGGAEVVQEIISQVTEQARTWDEIYEEIAARELAILDRLKDGRALEEHMETFYLATLRSCVLELKSGKGKAVKDMVVAAAAAVQQQQQAKK